MSRSDDFATYLSNMKGLPPVAQLQDMTPIPLTTSDASPATGTSTATGPWIKNRGTAGWVHVELSDTTSPTATVVVEGSNTQSGKGPVILDTLPLSVAGQGASLVTLMGAVWIRVRVTAISGTNASVTATYGSAS